MTDPTIPELADLVRQGCDADERDVNRHRPQACPTCHQPVHDPSKLLDGIKYDCGHYFTWQRLFDLHEREEQQATRAHREVASKRGLLDEVIGWRHDSECWSRNGPGLSCDCGLDKRVRAVLTHLAQPYQTNPEKEQRP